jgi:hypothetical protein
MTSTVNNAIELIQMEYAELPGLALTFWQVQRLFRLSDDVCTSALSDLVGRGCLERTGTGQYVRRPAELPASRFGGRWLVARNAQHPQI